MEYLKTAMIPGMIRSIVHKIVKIVIRRLRTKDFMKYLNPPNISSMIGPSFLINLRKYPDTPSVIGPINMKPNKLPKPLGELVTGTLTSSPFCQIVCTECIAFPPVKAIVSNQAIKHTIPA